MITLSLSQILDEILAFHGQRMLRQAISYKNDPEHKLLRDQFIDYQGFVSWEDPLSLIDKCGFLELYVGTRTVGHPREMKQHPTIHADWCLHPNQKTYSINSVTWLTTGRTITFSDILLAMAKYGHGWKERLIDDFYADSPILPTGEQLLVHLERALNGGVFESHPKCEELTRKVKALLRENRN